MDQKGKSLVYEDVKARVQGATPETLQELYDFGERLVADAVERLSRLDAKAASLAAFGGALITIAVSTSPVWTRFASRFFGYVALLGISMFFIGALLAVGSIYPQATEWYSENDWLRTECLQASDTMLRYRVLTMWQVLTSHYATFRRKTLAIKKATVVMGIGVGALFLAFLNILWRHGSF